jgi:hypothetical protein
MTSASVAHASACASFFVFVGAQHCCALCPQDHSPASAPKKLRHSEPSLRSEESLFDRAGAPPLAFKDGSSFLSFPSEPSFRAQRGISLFSPLARPERHGATHHSPLLFPEPQLS